MHHFDNIFRTSLPENIEEAVAHVPNLISQEVNDSLTSEFTAREVELALKQMAPLKAPSPDGMPPLFFQKYWKVVGPEVTQGVLSCLNFGHILNAINHTFITLIPKIKTPEKITEFRPISLCNVIYKLISKVIANRLKGILPSIISEAQSAFVPGRLITDNVLVVFETLHHMHSTKIGREGAMAMKLDMSKAYDRVEWSFLETIMRKMGFHPKWVSLIMNCISTVSYSILVNGEPHGFLKPSRGIRQGDSISPYLFLLCAEGLHYLISNAKDRGSLQGISLCRNGPKITHLFFADDCLLFSKATLRDCAIIQGILTTYENASGQQVNRDKTAIFFSKAAPMTTQNAIKDSLGVPIIRQYEKYLGLPSLVGRHRVASFSHIKERVWSKIKGWKGRILSQAGREIMIKAVAQAVPTYAMSCFKLPVQLCQEIEAMIQKFWWSQGQDQNKICWVKWKSLCHPKGVGGMGFRELRKFNDALLGKQVWRLLKNTSSLFHRVFKAKFFPNGTLLDAKTNRRGSYAWQSILKARDNILKGAAWRVRDGKTIKIWRDKWLLEDHHQKIVFPGPAVLAESTVSQLFIPNVQRWDENLIDKLFQPYDAAAIKCIPLSNQVTKDVLIWRGTKSGVYSVRSGYRFLLEEELKNLPSSSSPSQMNQVWRAVWSLQVPRKIQMFTWRALKDSLPSKLNLWKRKVVQDPICELCSAQTEDLVHAFWDCPSIHSAWAKEDWLSSICEDRATDFFDLWTRVAGLSSPNMEVFSTMCWVIWQRRNKLRLNKPAEKAENVGIFARGYLEEFSQSQNHFSTVPRQPPHPVVRWQRPSQCCFKVNYDGAIFKNSDEAGLGIVIRDMTGQAIATLSQKIKYPQSVEAMEALAARRAVQFTIELGLREAEFEGDSTIITEALIRGSYNQAAFGPIIEDARCLTRMMHIIFFSHVKRSGNIVAHTLARRAQFCSIPVIRMGNVPSELESLLQQDSSF
jgi:ribonuclease HI